MYTFLSESFLQKWKIVSTTLTELLAFQPSSRLTEDSYLEEISRVVENINLLIKETEEIGLCIKPLYQIQFHLDNLIRMSHLSYNVRWQYAEAVLKEIRVFNQLAYSKSEPNSRAFSFSTPKKRRVVLEKKERDTLTLADLPPEMVNHIARFLPYQSLRSLKHASHFFNTPPCINEELKKTLKTIIPTEFHDYFLLSNGQAYIKRGYYYPDFTEIKLSNNQPIKEIIVGHSDVFFIDITGSIHTAGSNTSGQMGHTNDSVIPKHKPVPFSGDLNYPMRKIITGGYRTFIQDTAGKWFGFGNNENNALGLASPRTASPLGYTSKVEPLFSAEIENIVCGFNHTFFLIKNQWYVSGYGGYGEFGMPSHEVPAQSPFQIHLPNNEAILDIVAGHSTTFFKGSSGQWYACGDNEHGSLGIKLRDPRNSYREAKVTRPTAIKLPNNKKIINIVCCYTRTYLEDEAGNWYGCGQSYSNQLALRGDIGKVDVPTPICFNTSEHSIKKLNFGYRTHYFLDTNNDWWQFGGEAKLPKKFNIETLSFEEESYSQEAIMQP